MLGGQNLCSAQIIYIYYLYEPRNTLPGRGRFMYFVHVPQAEVALFSLSAGSVGVASAGNTRLR